MAALCISRYFIRRLSVTPRIQNRVLSARINYMKPSCSEFHSNHLFHSKGLDEQESYQSALGQLATKFKDTCGLSNVSLDNHEQMLITQWNDGQKLEYPFLWLRDNCKCDQCFHEAGQVRQVIMKDIDINVHPTDLQFDPEKEEILLTWNNGHKSVFTGSWLWQQRFTAEHQANREKLLFIKPKLWGSEYQHEIKSFDFNEMLKDKSVFHEWMVAVEEFGLVFIKDAPAETGQVHKIMDNLTFQRMTHYGPFYQVHYRPENISNLSYANAYLDLHTDLPNCYLPPAIALLHCIKQVHSPGGDSMFVNGLKVAKQMKKEFPAYYKLLCEVPIDFYAEGTDYYGRFDKRATQTVFSFDVNGELIRLHVGSFQRVPFIRASPKVARDVLKAMYTFMALCYSPENLITHKLQPGEIVCMHNYHVLHGRKSFLPVHNMERTLEGFYLDLEELWSCRRVLEEDLGIRL